jgi:hypothetical protein
MILKPGSRWKSAVCDAEVVVVRPAKDPVVLECGGQPMLAPGDARPESLSPAADDIGGVHVGKRYSDPDTGFEVLGVKAGRGALSIDGRLLGRKDAKALPASD